MAQQGMPGFERAQVDFRIANPFNIKLGVIRNPFGIWDDYSLLRNLSLTKTDSLTLGTKLRRVDMGVLVYGDILGKYLKYSVGVLDGEYYFRGYDRDQKKDAVARIESSFWIIDLGINGYARGLENIGGGNEFPYAAGVDFRIHLLDNLIMLGEFVYSRNKIEDFETKSGYLQFNYDLDDFIEGLRWNLFLEAYKTSIFNAHSGMFSKIVYRGSAGFLYALSRNLDLGAQVIVIQLRANEQDYQGVFKIDARF